MIPPQMKNNWGNKTSARIAKPPIIGELNSASFDRLAELAEGDGEGENDSSRGSIFEGSPIASI